jgi:hypothetical protein
MALPPTKRLALLLLVLAGLLIGLFWQRTSPYFYSGESGRRLDRHAVRSTARAWLWQQFRARVGQGQFRESYDLLAMLLRFSPPVESIGSWKDANGFICSDARVLLREDYIVCLGNDNARHRWRVNQLYMKPKLKDGQPFNWFVPVTGGTNLTPFPYNFPSNFVRPKIPSIISAGQ